MLGIWTLGTLLSLCLVSTFVSAQTDDACISVQSGYTGALIVNCSVVTPRFKGPKNRFDVSLNRTEVVAPFRVAYHARPGTSPPPPSDPSALYTFGTTYPDDKVQVQLTPGVRVMGAYSPSIENATWTEFSLNFNCSGDDYFMLAVSLTVQSERVNQSYIALLIKECVPNSCQGYCNTTNGFCDSTVNQCVCQPFYSRDLILSNCDFGFGTNHAEYCPMDNVTLSWVLSPQHTSVKDFFVVYPPAPPSIPFRTPSDISENGAITPHTVWRYTDLKAVAGGDEIIYSGDFHFTVYDNLPGHYTYAFYTDDSYNLRALGRFVVHPANHSSCIAKHLGNVPPTSCKNGGVLINNQCLCPQGFFGYHCEHGCGGELIYTGRGVVVSSSVTGSGMYINNMNCTWILRPELPTPVSSFLVYFRTLEMGYNDYVYVYMGDRILGTPLDTFEGIQPTPPTIPYLYDNTTTPSSTPAITINFISGPENPSNPWQQMNGFTLRVSAQGCPPGKRLHVDHLTQLVDCVACEPGYYNPSYDAEVCNACPAQSFSSTHGSVTCTKCPTGSFQPAEGQSLCLSCSEYGYPAPCPEDTTLTSAQNIALNVVGGLLLLLTIAIILSLIYYRKERSITSSSLIHLFICLAGVVLIITATFVRSADANVSSCEAYPILMHIGRCFIIASIYAKELQLYRIFQGKQKFSRAAFIRFFATDATLVLLGCLIIIIVRAAISPVQPINPLLPRCTSDYEFAFSVTQSLYEVVWLGGIAVLIHRVRNVPIAYSDLYVISGVSFILTLDSMISMLLAVGFSIDYVDTRLSTVIVHLFTVGVILYLLFIPKLYRAYQSKSAKLIYSPNHRRSTASSFPQQLRAQSPTASGDITSNNTNSNDTNINTNTNTRNSNSNDGSNGSGSTKIDELATLYVSLDQEEEALKQLEQQAEMMKRKLEGIMASASAHRLKYGELMYELTFVEGSIKKTGMLDVGPGETLTGKELDDYLDNMKRNKGQSISTGQSSYNQKRPTSPRGRGRGIGAVGAGDIEMGNLGKDVPGKDHPSLAISVIDETKSNPPDGVITIDQQAAGSTSGVASEAFTSTPLHEPTRSTNPLAESSDITRLSGGTFAGGDTNHQVSSDKTPSAVTSHSTVNDAITHSSSDSSRSAIMSSSSGVTLSFTPAIPIYTPASTAHHDRSSIGGGKDGRNKRGMFAAMNQKYKIGTTPLISHTPFPSPSPPPLPPSTTISTTISTPSNASTQVLTTSPPPPLTSRDGSTASSSSTPSYSSSS